MKIFIDFDDVIFNTKKFSKNFKKIFRDNGIAEEIFKKYYYGITSGVNKKQISRYDFEKHLERIEKETGLETKKIRKKIEALQNQCPEYVFPDAIKFLEAFPKKDLFLVSYNDTVFQAKKIKKSGVAKYFKQIILTDDMKAKPIKQIIKKEKIKKEEAVFFIEDRVEQIKSVKKSYPQITTIFMRRKEGRYQDKQNKFCDTAGKNFWDVLKIIKTKNGKQ